MTFAVKTIYNTDEHGKRVPDDMDEDDMPCTFHGPFDSLAAAEAWMLDEYPDGDEDVYEQYADDYDPSEYKGFLNDPKAIYGDVEEPDEDIRDEVFEPPC